MNRNEIRYRATSALLKAGGPVALARMVTECGVERKELLPVLKELVAEKLVVRGKLTPRARSAEYCWAARWEAAEKERALGPRKRLIKLMAPFERRFGRCFEIDGEAAKAYHDFIVNEYAPPKDKRFLVFLQCSVRRPFSKSPSHGSMKRAIKVATGFDPKKDFESCPVHVVVLASRVGPAPYDLEDVYPINVSSGGVKQMRPEHYERVRPVLARRMADYITSHRTCYDRMATFTEGRYGEVMADAAKIARVKLPVLPTAHGPVVTAMGESRPRKYWEKLWIQLYLEIVSWLDRAARARAAERLAEFEVTHTGRARKVGSRRKPK